MLGGWQLAGVQVHCWAIWFAAQPPPPQLRFCQLQLHTPTPPGHGGFGLPRHRSTPPQPAGLQVRVWCISVVRQLPAPHASLAQVVHEQMGADGQSCGQLAVVSFQVAQQVPSPQELAQAQLPFEQ